MKFKIPFTFSDIEILRRKNKKFTHLFARVKNRKLDEHLKTCDVKLNSAEYLGICFKTFLIVFIFLLTIFTSTLFFLKMKNFYFYGFGASLLFSIFILSRQLGYARVFAFQKEREIEKNLIPALQDMLVQLESGVPIYQIIANISSSDYSFVSSEFGKAVKAINSGVSQVDALENLIKKNSSVYFKRVLWQISNGMRSGSDMSIVIKDSVDSLSKEQAIQIQAYGSKLNPLIMFYMLIAVILPSLGIAFLTILSSMLNLSGDLVKLLFIGIFVMIVLIQIMFLGMIKTRRPSLL